eukprot:TRINITY_DN1972_c0_g2_i1.p1 TRINITY_DN1972_c0_g2~~TRINITY_DN1972_c0_g2_i1.p1  ORF type:complete len:495 (+),score=66.25 TRINITY_DN1972_c0_g2_i1:246-1730(+)
MVSKEVGNGLGSVEHEARRTWTVMSLAALSLVKGVDMALLPCSFRAIEKHLGLSPTHLGFLALCQGLACAATGPMWGAMIDCGASRKRTLQGGAMLWGFCACLLAFVTEFQYMCTIRFVNGACLAMMLPTLMPMVAALTTDADRGAMFGLVEFSATLGGLLCAFFVLPIAELTVFGMRGWQFALLATGIFSMVAAWLLQFTVHEEPRTWYGHKLSFSRELRKVSTYLSIPSYAIMVLQGMFGTIPAAAKSFTFMYLNYMGVSHFMIGILMTFAAIGETTGCLMGGWIGDGWEKQSPNRGRIYTALVSMSFGMIFIYLIYGFVASTYHNDLNMFVKVTAGLMFLDGLTSSWCVPGCLYPALISILPQRRIASGIAWEYGMVFVSGNTIGPMSVGLVSQIFFGYNLPESSQGHISKEQQIANGHALGKAVLVSSLLPSFISICVCSLLFLTYAKDRGRAKLEDELTEESTDGEFEELLSKQGKPDVSVASAASSTP